MSRLTRREIKRDEVLESLERGVDAARRHRRGILAAVAAVVGVLVAGAVTWGQLERRAGRAQAVLAEAIAIHQAPVDPAAGASSDPANLRFADAASKWQRAEEAFERLRDEYGSSRAARIAEAYLAQLAIERGDAATARQLWEACLEGDADHMLAAEVWVNLTALDREQGRGREVAGEIEEWLDDGDAPVPADVLLYELGRTLAELGDTNEAREAYERLLDEHPDSPFASEARRGASL